MPVNPYEPSVPAGVERAEPKPLASYRDAVFRGARYGAGLAPLFSILAAVTMSRGSVARAFFEQPLGGTWSGVAHLGWSMFVAAAGGALIGGLLAAGLRWLRGRL